MLNKTILETGDLSAEIVQAVGNRLETGQYTDAILAATRLLTRVLREKSGAEGDGAQLVGQALGGNSPLIRLNNLQTQSERDEQKGYESLIRGFYVGIRNFRTHEEVQDEENFCIRALIMIDTFLCVLNRDVEEFNIQEFADKIFDPYFTDSNDYAEELVSRIPDKYILKVFDEAFKRRGDGDTSKLRFAFAAMYQKIPSANLTDIVSNFDDALRNQTDEGVIADIFRLMKPELWVILDDYVNQRMENMIIESVKKGHYDYYQGLIHGSMGTWANTFGRYFKRRKELSESIISSLLRDWYSQNYVAQYLFFSMPSIITEPNLISQAVDNLAYAAIGNNAKGVRSKILKTFQNFPDEWKNYMKVFIQQRQYSDPDFAKKVLTLLD